MNKKSIRFIQESTERIKILTRKTPNSFIRVIDLEDRIKVKIMRDRSLAITLQKYKYIKNENQQV